MKNLQKMVRLMRSAASVRIVLAVVLILELLQDPSPVTAGNSRADFRSDFVFGAGSSAFQVEGAAFEDGKTPSIMDTFFHADTGDVATDEYHKYKEDVKLMADTGLQAYRFSISWSRLIPNGRGPVNPKAVEYYNNLINELIIHGIQPHVVLLHFDLPQALADEYGGWLNQQFVKDFTAYADVCFRHFGNRILYWTTINESNMLIQYCFNTSVVDCHYTKEPYIGAHNMLLGHASVVRLYRTKYQDKQRGFIGLNIFASWYVPETDAKEDLLAAKRAGDFKMGWFIKPLVGGDYPDIMKKFAGKRFPYFTERESKLVKNSFDFIGLNCYSASIVRNSPNNIDKDVRSYTDDMEANVTSWNVGGSVLQPVMEHFKQVYGNPPIYIHETGYQTAHDAPLNDTPRIKYLNDSIGSLHDAVRNGSNAKGYFVWSFLDVFEINGGYKSGFGLYYVDFDDSDLKRYPKHSAKWYSAFLKGGSSNTIGLIEQVNNSTSMSETLEV